MIASALGSSSATSCVNALTIRYASSCCGVSRIGMNCSASDSGRYAIVDVVTCGTTAASAVGAMEAEEAASEAGSPAEERCSVACAS